MENRKLDRSKSSNEWNRQEKVIKDNIPELKELLSTAVRSMSTSAVSEPQTVPYDYRKGAWGKAVGL